MLLGYRRGQLQIAPERMKTRGQSGNVLDVSSGESEVRYIENNTA